MESLPPARGHVPAATGALAAETVKVSPRTARNEALANARTTPWYPASGRFVNGVLRPGRSPSMDPTALANHTPVAVGLIAAVGLIHPRGLQIHSTPQCAHADTSCSLKLGQQPSSLLWVDHPPPVCTVEPQARLENQRSFPQPWGILIVVNGKFSCR